MYDLLGCSDVDLRIQAGEAVALLYEAARIHDEDYYWNREGELCAALKGMEWLPISVYIYIYC